MMPTSPSDSSGRFFRALPQVISKRARLAVWTRYAATLGTCVSVTLAGLTAGCSDSEDTEPGRVWQCLLKKSESPDFIQEIGCDRDFRALASPPLDASIPGARSVKHVIDLADEGELYFQNSKKYQIHWDFASQHLSGKDLPIVPSLSDFNRTEYFSPDRRFVLGSLTHYEGPDKYAYEIAPYDTASAEMIADAYQRIAEHTFLGDKLYFHPTSQSITDRVGDLPASVQTIDTDQLFEGIDYQALNPAESYGRLRFIKEADLKTDYVTFREIAVLDRVPNDISVLMGIITEEFQTPLSHVNVLSQNRGTPNMALRGAYANKELLALDGKWVRLKVDAFDYEIEEVSKEEADAWWDANKPGQVNVPGMDLTATDLRNAEDMLELDTLSLYDATKKATRAFGGKAAHFAGLAQIEDFPMPKGFAIPLYYYRQFMEQNGFDVQVDEMLADPEFQDDPKVRDDRLLALREAMMAAPVDADFETLLMTKLADEFPDTRMRFRSSTNAEDLDGFTGAGLYTSKSGDPNDPTQPVLDAVREVWSSVWFFRAFEERTYRSIDHKAVGMAMLVHRSFPAEEANGVALTNNPFDRTGLQPAFYVNVQAGGTSVVQPPDGVSTDQFVYYFDTPGTPISFVSQSNLLKAGEHVLTARQTHDLGLALDKIRTYFAQAYQPAADDPNQWWAMDVEFKFDGPDGEEPVLFVKQARPFGHLDTDE